MIVDDLDLPLTVDEFINETREIFDQLFPDCTVMSGKKIGPLTCFRISNYSALSIMYRYRQTAKLD